MIDIENQIITAVANAVQTAYSDVEVGAGYDKVPDRFPFVSIMEMDNYSDSKFRTTESSENFAVVTYEVNIYSNREGKKKTDCRNIAKVVDETLRKLNFTRLSLIPVPNMKDSTVFRIVGRYRAEVDTNNRLYYRR